MFDILKDSTLPGSVPSPALCRKLQAIYHYHVTYEIELMIAAICVCESI